MFSRDADAARKKWKPLGSSHLAAVAVVAVAAAAAGKLVVLGWCLKLLPLLLLLPIAS